MSLKKNLIIWYILLLIILYTLQGFIQGLTKSIPLFLASHNATWIEQGTFSWVYYPFSFKIFWAPIIDSIYSRRMGGRHQTWLAPIQILVGIILLILSFYVESLLVNLQNLILTIIFFVLYFLIATQDIVVDGWSILIFSNTNPQWASTCQTIGQMTGYFIGSTILMILESANFTNKYIRKPLSLSERPFGLFSLQQFTFFWGIVFIIVSLIITVTFFWKKQLKQKNNIDIPEETATKLNLVETYLAIWKLLKKPCMRKLIFIVLTFNIGFAATSFMTNLTLMSYGITRETLALFNVPLIVVHILVPLCLSKVQRPLVWFTRAYIPRLIISLILAIYIFFTPQIFGTLYFYPVLILLLCINEAFAHLIMVPCIGFFARISEPQIAGTYMTLLAAIINLGQTLLSTCVLYIANWLPKPYAYSIEVGICLVLGLIWIGLMWRMTRRLEELPIEDWYLDPSESKSVSSNTTTIQPNILEGGINI